MLKGHDKRNAVRNLLGLDRTTREGTLFNTEELGDGEFFDSETRASMSDGGIEINNISHVYILNCGCIANSSSAVVVCDICGRRICQDCVQICSHCNLRGCRYCVKLYQIDGDKFSLCEEGYSSQKRSERIRKVSSGILNFFTKREG